MPDFLISDIVARMRMVKGVKAIVLGGSYATGSQRPDSDIDIGIYYDNASLEISQIRQIAIDMNDFPNPVVTGLGEWGRWVNGGAWLTVKGQRVDLLYRDIGFVSQIIDDCLEGQKQSDYYQQPAYGFHSYMYCAETQVCKVLYDPVGVIEALKSKVAIYPQPLKQTIVQSDMWGTEFTLRNCMKSAERGEVFIVAGCLTRIASYLVQTLYALNETYRRQHHVRSPRKDIPVCYACRRVHEQLCPGDSQPVACANGDGHSRLSAAPDVDGGAGPHFPRYAQATYARAPAHTRTAADTAHRDAGAGSHARSSA